MHVEIVKSKICFALVFSFSWRVFLGVSLTPSFLAMNLSVGYKLGYTQFPMSFGSAIKVCVGGLVVGRWVCEPTLVGTKDSVGGWWWVGGCVNQL